MIALIGLVVVLGSVIGGFTMGGGQLMALFHVSEVIVICGTALGTVLISSPLPAILALTKKLPQLVQPSPFSKGLYLDSLKMLYELFQIARRDGLVAIETHIESPSKSTVFKKYPSLLKHHHAVTFLCDSLRLVLVGSVPPYDLEQLMDSEIEVHHEAEQRPIAILQKVSDGLPGIGIVGPMAGGMEHQSAAETRYYHFLKASVVAFAKGFPPIVAVEFSRREIYADDRPTFTEMETACKALKGKAA